MWIRKLASEITWDRATDFLFAMGVDGLVAMIVWFLLLRISILVGLISKNSVSGAIGCAVVAIGAVALYHSKLRELRQNKSTVVCDRCNTLKAMDTELDCKCGGHYFPLDEMKWVNARVGQSEDRLA